MEFEFDKEMDSLLRQAARDSGVVSKNFDAHADADEISLFAENALPVKARVRVTEHLADCNRCRKILSNVISLNSETESENVHAKEIVAVSAVPVAWYKKLFAFPQIAFAMGALALVFSGVIAFMVLQNVRETQNDSVAQLEDVQEKPQNAKGMSSDGETTSSESYSMPNSAATSNMTSANSTSNISPASLNAPTAGMNKPNGPVSSMAANSNSSISVNEEPIAADKDLKPSPKVVKSLDQPAESGEKQDFKVTTSPPQKKENEYRADKDEAISVQRQQTELSQNSVAQNQSGIMPDARNVQRAPSARAESKAAGARRNSASEEEAAKEKSSNLRSVGGKTFKYSEGVWYDSAYNQQRTTNIRRGTDDYKKLDSGLRSIAENLGGVVVVVWKDKAYRIQ